MASPQDDKIVTYEHHGAVVSVRESLQGRHREHCLCYRCDKFKPGEKDNCPLAKALYDMCVKNDMVTPVWECKAFGEKTVTPA